MLVIFFPLLLSAQDENPPDSEPLWKTGASFGLDFSQLLQINPRQGAGQNRIGSGIAIGAFAKYKKKSA